jgi:hypothetical protein
MKYTMEATRFKTELKKIKENLRGITLSVQSKYSTLAFYKLADFGQEILKHEAYGKSFSIQQVWTNDGIKSAKTFNELKKIFKKLDGLLGKTVLKSYCVFAFDLFAESHSRTKPSIIVV